MSVIVKNEGVWQYCKAFGISQSLLDEAEKFHVNITLNMGKDNRFVVTDHQGGLKGTIPITAAVLNLAKQGKLGPASQAAIKFQIEGMVTEAIDKAKKFPSEGGKPTTSEGATEITEAPPVATKEKPVPSKPTAATGSPVPLEDATSLYQPVFGTSSGSIYTVIALFEGCQLALRRQDTQASFRAEGGSLHEYVDALTDMGFTGKKGGHLSLHVNISQNEEGLLLKTLGAIVGRVGFYRTVSVGEVYKLEIAS